MKTSKLYLSAIIGFFCISSNVYSQVEIPDNQTIKIGNKDVSIFIGNTGKYAQASNFDLDPANTLDGIFIENGTSESGGFYADGDFSVIWSAGDQNRLLRIYDEDNMSPGSTTYERAYIDGNGTYYAVSDTRQKQDITQISGAIVKIKAINGVQYTYIKNANEEKPKNDIDLQGKAEPKKYIGLLAQDVEKAIPEVVDTDAFGNKFLNYTGIIPVLVEACKDQQKLIEDQQTKLDGQTQALTDLLKEINSLKEEVAKLKTQKSTSN